MTQILYKFREIDKYAIDILVNKRLYLSPWTTLNDPHEAQMYTKDTIKPYGFMPIQHNYSELIRNILIGVLLMKI